jgi:hypothetical protein
VPETVTLYVSVGSLTVSVDEVIVKLPELLVISTVPVTPLKSELVVPTLLMAQFNCVVPEGKLLVTTLYVTVSPSVEKAELDGLTLVIDGDAALVPSALTEYEYDVPPN